MGRAAGSATDHAVAPSSTGATITLPDGRMIAVSGGSDRWLRIWDLASGGPIGDPLPLPNSIRAAAGFYVNGPTFIVPGHGVMASAQIRLGSLEE
jgi:hypothetical protein